jgi:hypothetical protein
METGTTKKVDYRRMDVLAPELKQMCRQRQAQKALGDESWWDALENEIVGLPEVVPASAEKFVRQSQAEKGLEWVGE